MGLNISETANIKKIVFLISFFLFLFFGAETLAADCNFDGWNHNDCTVDIYYEDPTGGSNLDKCEWKVGNNADLSDDCSTVTGWTSACSCSGSSYTCLGLSPGAVCSGQGINACQICSKATDKAGNVGYSAPKYLNIDFTAPTVTITGAPTSWQHTDAVANITCTDPYSGCDNTTYKLKTYTTNPGTCSTTYTDYNLTSPQTISSHLWVCGAAKDVVGNTGFSSPVEFRVDKEKPVSQITAPEAGSTVTADFNVTVSDTDTGGSGINTSACWYYVYDSVAGQTRSSTLRTCNVNQLITVGVGKDCQTENGTCTVYVYSYDNASNLSNTNSRSFLIRIDLTPPVITINTPSGQWYNSNPLLDVDFSDDKALDSGYYQVDSYTGTWVAIFTDHPGTSYTTDFSIANSIWNGFVDGSSHTIYFKAADDAGNVTGADGSKYLVIKKNAKPTCTGLSGSPSSGYSPLSVIFAGSGNDTDGSIVSYQWDFNGDDTWDQITSVNSAGYIYTAPATYCAKLRVQDDRGFWSDTPATCPATCAATITVLGDTEAPQPGKLYITPSQYEQTYPIKVKKDQIDTYKVDVTDNQGVASCDLYIKWTNQGQMFPIPAGCTTACTFIRDFTFYSLGTFGGNYALCKDLAGNSGQGPAVEIKVEPPEGNRNPIITSGPDYTTYPCLSPTTQPGCLVYFRVEAYDPDGDILTYSWDFGDKKTSPDHYPSHQYETISPSPPGYYLAKVTVSDGRGGEAVGSVQVPVKAPTLSVGACAGFNVNTLCLNPFFGKAPLNNVDLKANVSGTMFGTITYQFYCQKEGSLICSNTVDTFNYSLSQCRTDTGIGALCSYPEIGVYTAKVLAMRGIGSESAEVTIKATEIATECAPGDTAVCTSPQGCTHLITCQADGTWPISECQNDQCVKGSIQSCGSKCGTQTCQANCSWGTCTGEGICSPGQVESCVSGGTKTCQANCSWGTCQGVSCTPGDTQLCGKCGTQTCLTGSIWGACTGEGICSPGQVESCVGGGTRTCQANCSWETCVGIGCTPGASRSCGRCGTQVCQQDRTWGPCLGQRVCYPGSASPYCPCPEDGCLGSTYYDYPQYGGCTSDCACQPCLATTTFNDSRCVPTLAADLKVATDEENWFDNLAKTFPINGVDLKATVMGTATGTVNYEFDCTNDGNWEYTPDTIDLSNSDSDWISRTDNQGHTYDTKITAPNIFAVKDICNYSVAGTYTAKVRVERGVLSYLDTALITAENKLPGVGNLSSIWGPDEYCFSLWPPVHLSWEFNDPGDRQSGYRVLIDDEQSFSQPWIIDTGRVESPSNSYSPPTFGDTHLNFNTTYYWRVEVWDSFGASSGLSDEWNSFTTEPAYPWPDFDWAPPRPSAGEEVQLCATIATPTCDDLKLSTCYDTAPNPIPSSCSGTGKTFNWSFPSNVEPVTGTNSSENPKIKFLSLSAENKVKLKITDNVGHSCEKEKNIGISLPLPEWEEIPPF